MNGPTEDEELTAAVKTISTEGHPVIAATFDVTDIADHDTRLAFIESHLGPLTTLVNNAGVGVLSRGDPLGVSPQSWDRCLAVNTKAMFFLSQAFARRLIARKRPESLFHSIVNVTSRNAKAVTVSRAEYAASKVAAMVPQTFAVRLGREGIHVYDVQPGLIATEMTASVIAQYEQRAKDGLTVLPRIGTPEDMGKIIAALASGQMPYTTGQVIDADGGLLIPRY